jgi:uncharacterized protein involved in outer membrane biogenesis
MTDAKSSPATTRPKRWPRRIAFIAAGLFLILIVLYFVGTSSAFFKGVILPRASKAMNAQITVSDASVSPFSRVVLKGLQVKTTTPEPLVAAQEVRARYSLWAILGGTVKVDEVVVTAPQITLVTDASGKSNLIPLRSAPPFRGNTESRKSRARSNRHQESPGGKRGDKSGAGTQGRRTRRYGNSQRESECDRLEERADRQDDAGG